MTRKVSALAAMLFAASLSPATRADDFDFARYEPATYAQARDHIAGAMGDPPAPGRHVFLVDPDAHAWRMRLRHTGEVRPLATEVREAMAHWRTAMRWPDGYFELFQQEARFDTEDGSAWLPVQTVLLAPLREEASVGQTVNLYVTLLGGVDGLPVLTVNEFEVVAPID